MCSYTTLFPPQVQDYALPLVEPHEIPPYLILQYVQVTVNDGISIWPTSHSSQFCISGKLTEGTKCAIVQLIN